MRKGETKLDKERRLNKEIPEQIEKILSTGLEGKEGDKWAKEVFKEEEKKMVKDQLTLVDQLSSKKNIYTYSTSLYDMLRGFLELIQSQWKFHVAYNKEGIIMELKSPYDGKLYRSAFKITGDPVLDVNAVQVFALRAENTIERVEERLYARQHPGEGTTNIEDTGTRSD